MQGLLSKEHNYLINLILEMWKICKGKEPKSFKMRASTKRVQRGEQNCNENMSLLMHPDHLQSVAQRRQCLLLLVCTTLGMLKTD